MGNELPPLPDARPVVAFVVLSATITCCCLLSATTGAVAYWRSIRTIHPAPLTASPATHMAIVREAEAGSPISYPPGAKPVEVTFTG